MKLYLREYFIESFAYYILASVIILYSFGVNYPLGCFALIVLGLYWCLDVRFTKEEGGE